MSSVDPDFATRLRCRMEELDMTVPALVERCGEAFSIRTIFRWRGGQAAPGIEALPILASALDTTCDWLCGVDLSNDKE